MAEKLRIAVVEDDPNDVAIMRECIEHQPDMTLVGVGGSAEEGYRLVTDQYPDALVLDVMLNGQPAGLNLFKKLKDLGAECPYIVAVTLCNDKAMERYFNTHGALVQCKFLPDYCPEKVLEIIRDMVPHRREQQDAQRNGEALMRLNQEELELHMMKRIREKLGRIQLNAGNQSDGYLARTIYLGVRYGDPRLGVIDMENDIYPRLIKEGNFAPHERAKPKMLAKRIERGMRSRIEYVWDHVDPDVLRAEYTNYVNPDKGKPELKEFIAYYVNLFR